MLNSDILGIAFGDRIGRFAEIRHVGEQVHAPRFQLRNQIVVGAGQLEHRLDGVLNRLQLGLKDLVVFAILHLRVAVDEVILIAGFVVAGMRKMSAGENAEEGIIIAGWNRIEFMIVTARATHR